MGKSDFEIGVPYVVELAPELAELAAEKTVKTSLSVFRVQFPASASYKDEGRGQVAFTSDHKNKAREVTLNLAPKACSRFTAPPSEADSVAVKMITQVSLFGCKPGMVWQGLERTVSHRKHVHVQWRARAVAMMYAESMEGAASSNLV